MHENTRNSLHAICTLNTQGNKILALKGYRKKLILTALYEDICVDNFQVETRTQVEACGQQTSDHEII